MNVAILGTGKIGCDLLTKILKESDLHCAAFIGRREESEGIMFAKQLGVRTEVNGVSALNNLSQIDAVFDATSAVEHESNKPTFKKLNSKIINLTPALTKFRCVPAINLDDVRNEQHISMVTCGGQAAIPIAFALKRAVEKIDYLEIVSSISSSSAGLATRQNIGNYQTITENTLIDLTGISNVKSILIINPATPPITMQTTIYATAKQFDFKKIQAEVGAMAARVQHYTPGYKLIGEPIYDDNRIVIMIKVVGNGDYLPAYAGNLDIITSAAIEVAKRINK